MQNVRKSANRKRLYNFGGNQRLAKNENEASYLLCYHFHPGYMFFFCQKILKVHNSILLQFAGQSSLAKKTYLRGGWAGHQSNSIRTFLAGCPSPVRPSNFCFRACSHTRANWKKWRRINLNLLPVSIWFTTSCVVRKRKTSSPLLPQEFRPKREWINIFRSASFLTKHLIFSKPQNPEIEQLN